MKFEVKFQSESGYAAYLAPEDSSRKVGLNDLDSLRRVAGEKIPLNLVCSDIESWVGNPKLEVTEAYARSCAHFKETGLVVVTVPEKALNRFGVKFYEKSGSDYWKVQLRVNGEKLLTAWMEAFCPLEWDPTGCLEETIEEGEEVIETVTTVTVKRRKS